MIHQTENLELDSDGDVWLKLADDDGERDVELLGNVENCGYRVPDELDDEFTEIESAWEQAGRDRRCYEAGHGTFWGR